MLNLSVEEKSPPQFGHLITCSLIRRSTLSFCNRSGISRLVFSCINLSALKELLHFMHFTIGSEKFCKCPEAKKTFLLIIWDPSISSILSRLTNSLLHKSRNLFFIFTPLGPYSQKPALVSE